MDRKGVPRITILYQIAVQETLPFLIQDDAVILGVR
jgi:hypothetical protein